jgi:formylglycine-generating enzyme required for sulfatase activity
VVVNKVDWQPAGWRPVVPVAGGEPELVKDWQGKTCYKRLWREVHGQRVEVVAIPQQEPSDPRTFYMMTNKVWNALFTAFTEEEKAECERLFKQYGTRFGRERLIRRQWHEGGQNAKGEDLGTGPGKEMLPVLRVTVTEAHCFAEWLGGKLPSRTQWLKAAGALDKNGDRLGPFDGAPNDLRNLAIHCEKGSWRVDEGDRDVSRKGCRQMASNGQEWTRSSISADGREIDLIPLDSLLRPLRAITMGQSYLAEQPLTFESMNAERETESVAEARADIGFRIVLQRD